jgi:acyl homoserine lactone synthase
MLRYVYGNDLAQFPVLRDSMFQDRAAQFARRLNWDVSVNADGEERDEYDDLNPLYVIWQRADGSHGGSMRFLPTIGRTMVAEHFADLTGGIYIESPLIWECTRFCLAPGAERRVSAALVLGAGEVMANFHLSHFIGVFDPRMERIYRMMGVEPDVIGSAGEGAQKIGVGLWEMRATAWPGTLAKVGVSRETSLNWFQVSFSQGCDVAPSVAQYA